MGFFFLLIFVSIFILLCFQCISLLILYLHLLFYATLPSYSLGELGSCKIVWPAMKGGWRIRYSCGTDGRPDKNNLRMDK